MEDRSGSSAPDIIKGIVTETCKHVLDIAGSMLAAGIEQQQTLERSNNVQDSVASIVDLILKSITNLTVVGQRLSKHVKDSPTVKIKNSDQKIFADTLKVLEEAKVYGTTKNNESDSPSRSHVSCGETLDYGKFYKRKVHIKYFNILFYLLHHSNYKRWCIFIKNNHSSKPNPSYNKCSRGF